MGNREVVDSRTRGGGVPSICGIWSLEFARDLNELVRKEFGCEACVAKCRRVVKVRRVPQSTPHSEQSPLARVCSAWPGCASLERSSGCARDENSWKPQLPVCGGRSHLGRDFRLLPAPTVPGCVTRGGASTSALRAPGEWGRGSFSCAFHRLPPPCVLAARSPWRRRVLLLGGRVGSLCRSSGWLSPLLPLGPVPRLSA